jgi:hypothetical protein
VDRTEALRYLGYAGQEVDAAFDARLDGVIERCEQVSNPGWMYRVFPVVEEQDGLHLMGTTLVLQGSDIRKHLQGARECAVMAATAGLGNERELQRLSQLNGLDGMMFDAASSALVEAVADACNAAIVAEGRSGGLYAKWRFSPGYGDFPLDIQPAVVRVLEADRRIGITVTESLLLLPSKSITAFVGLFDNPQDDKRSCANCSFAPYCNLKEKGTPCYR